MDYKLKALQLAMTTHGGPDSIIKAAEKFESFLKGVVAPCTAETPDPKDHFVIVRNGLGRWFLQESTIGQLFTKKCAEQIQSACGKTNTTILKVPV